MPTIMETVRVRGDGDVQMAIHIGSGQLGGYSMLLDSRELEPVVSDGSHAEYDLGKGAELRFSLLIGTVKVRDVNAATNQTTVTVTISQGQRQRIFRDQETAQTGGIVSYGIAVSFV